MALLGLSPAEDRSTAGQHTLINSWKGYDQRIVVWEAASWGMKSEAGSAIHFFKTEKVSQLRAF